LNKGDFKILEGDVLGGKTFGEVSRGMRRVIGEGSLLRIGGLRDICEEKLIQGVLVLSSESQIPL